MSIIEGEGDGERDDDEEEENSVVVAGDWDGPSDVNEGWGTRLVWKSSNGHQSNVVGGPNKNIVVSCLATTGPTATARPAQMRIGRIRLPKNIRDGCWENAEDP